ncbi:glycoside hydrolase family 79 protein [Rhexocercosporidium sp. MPI-PUGE-AT-0058]|nr:glycoside hydrolase family 79 protein [Rhexocercosporidium sp. MPI-PUGE-AT-0058]
MARMSIYLALANFYQSLVFASSSTTTVVAVPSSPPPNASPPILEAFVSYSIEFAFFPDFAGNSASPNTFSNNLLNNLGNLTGTKPYIRVGGNTQDYALYNASLKAAVNGTYNNARSPDYPTTIYIGPSFFDSYNTFPDTKYVHGFNLGLGGKNSAGWQTLLDTVPLACKSLGGDKLLWWEYGNEPDLFSTSAQGPVRPTTWHESEYVAQWLNGTRAIKDQLEKYCPELLGGGKYGYLAPSFAGTNNRLKPVLTWQDGLNKDGDVKIFSSHNYIGGATQPGVTLQGTLMNHAKTALSVASQVNVLKNLSLPSSIPFILGETNSLYNQGKPGLSNSFGAALWGLDFNLYCAAVGIRRVHMHMGTDYRYAAWQPIATKKTSIGTKPPYYGQVVAAAVIGELGRGEVKILNLPLQGELEAAYAAFVDGRLEKIAVLNMKSYNYTVNGTSSVQNPEKRGAKTYSFQVPSYYDGTVGVRRLLANGSDAITGVTWDGWSYNWELKKGVPVRLGNVTVGESVQSRKGLVSIEVLDSSAAVLEFGGK